jgi:hypothetical protein
LYKLICSFNWLHISVASLKMNENPTQIRLYYARNILSQLYFAINFFEARLLIFICTSEWLKWVSSHHIECMLNVMLNVVRTSQWVLINQYLSLGNIMSVEKVYPLKWSLCWNLNALCVEHSNMAFKFQQRLHFKGMYEHCKVYSTNIYIHSECLYCKYVCVGEVLKLSRYTNLCVCHSCFF